MIAAGAEAGTRVIYLGQESEHYYILLYACAKAGTVLVPVNWRLTVREVEHVLNDSGAQFVFVQPDYAHVVTRAAQSLQSPPQTISIIAKPDGGPSFAGWVADAAADELDTEANPDDAIVQMYTSGTTGLPKGAMLAHRTFFQVRNALAMADLDWIDWHTDDVSLVGVPAFHVGGLWWALQGFNAGITNVVLRLFTGAAAVAAIRTTESPSVV